MTSSFKRPQHACLPLNLDSLSSHLSLLTRLCTRLVTSNISATAIFYTPICNPCLPVCPRKAPLALDFIRQTFPGWSGELGPKLRTHSHVLSFPPSILNCVLLHYWSLVQLSDANSRWWLLPFGFVVAWLCQSRRLTSEEREMLAAHCESKLLFTYLFSFYHKLAEYVLTQRKTFCELNNLLNHRLRDDSVSVKMIQMSFSESLWIQRKYKIGCQEEANEKWSVFGARLKRALEELWGSHCGHQFLTLRAYRRHGCYHFTLTACLRLIISPPSVSFMQPR